MFCFIYPHKNSVTVFRGGVTGTWAGGGQSCGISSARSVSSLQGKCHEGRHCLSGHGWVATARSVVCGQSHLPFQPRPYRGAAEAGRGRSSRGLFRHNGATSLWSTFCTGGVGRQVTGCGPRPHRASNQRGGRR